MLFETQTDNIFYDFDQDDYVIYSPDGNSVLVRYKKFADAQKYVAENPGTYFTGDRSYVNAH